MSSQPSHNQQYTKICHHNHHITSHTQRYVITSSHNQPYTEICHHNHHITSYTQRYVIASSHNQPYTEICHNNYHNQLYIDIRTLRTSHPLLSVDIASHTQRCVLIPITYLTTHRDTLTSSHHLLTYSHNTQIFVYGKSENHAHPL